MSATKMQNGKPEVVNRLPAPKNESAVIIKPIEPKIVQIKIVGITPLLVCSWSHKAKQQMLDKQMKKGGKIGKEAKNPEENYQASLYKSTEGWTGVPAGGVKGCLVNACRAVDGVPMTLAKRMIFVRPDGRTEGGQDLVRVHGKHHIHEGMVRIDMGTADIRHRAMYDEWEIHLAIEFLENMISPEQICNLIELAGFVEGLCEHRPGSPKSNTGNYGRFQVKRD